MILLPAIMALQLVVSLPARAGDQSRENELKLRQIERMFAEYRRQFPNVPTLTAQEVIHMLSLKTSRVVLVDVRGPAEQAVSMIPHAITKNDFERNKEKLRAFKIICYCTIGYRSGLYAQKLRKKGLDASNLKGGVLSWAYAGQMFVHGGRITKRVHVYGPKWNLTPYGYEPTW